jgi:hypothetical protein
VFISDGGIFSNASASAAIAASFGVPLSQRLSVRPPKSRAQSPAPIAPLALRRLMGSWCARASVCVSRRRGATSGVPSQLQLVRSHARVQRGWLSTRGLRVAPPNHAFQGSAGQRGWPVPSSLRSSAPPERARWAS